MAGWRQAAYRGLRPLLFLADPERIHHLTLATLATAGGNPAGRALCRVVAGAAGSRHSAVELLGLRFRNRIGLGAGFDKDGVGLRGWAALGFGFVELGTVTPRPQPGNPRPRLLRLAADEALVNQMGFNNAGADALASRIAAARPHLPKGSSSASTSAATGTRRTSGRWATTSRRLAPSPAWPITSPST